MNGVHIAGYLGRDAELKMHRSGGARLSFSVAVSGYGGKDADGKSIKTTTWVPCVMWGERTVQLQQYLAKGAFVSVSGSLKSYQRKEGETQPVDMLYVQVDDLDCPKRQ